MQWHRWLRHRTTSWKVAGSIPDGVTVIFHWHNPSGCTMGLWLTLPLTEMRTSNISWGWRWPVHRADNLNNLHVPIVLKSGNLNLLETSRGLSRPVMGLLYLLLFHLFLIWKVYCVYDIEFLFHGSRFCFGTANEINRLTFCTPLLFGHIQTVRG